MQKLRAINIWLGRLFDPQNRDATVQALAASQGDPGVLAAEVAVRRRLAEAETALKRFQRAIAAGVEPEQPGSCRARRGAGPAPAGAGAPRRL